MSRTKIRIAEPKQSRQDRGEKLQYITICVMLIALFMRNAFSIGIPVIVLLGIMFIPLLFGNEDNIWATAAACIPLSKGFQFKYLLLASLIILVFRRGGKIRLSRSGMFILLMMLWEILHGFIGQFSIYEYLRSFAELLLLFIITGSDLKNINYKLIFRTLAVSTVGVCAIMLYIQLRRTHFNLQKLLSPNYRFGAGNTNALNFAFNFNPNGLGYICVLTVAVLLVLYGKKEHSLLDVCMAIAAALFGLLTLSRTYIVCLIFVIGAFALGASGSISKRVRNILGLACLSLVLLFVIYTFLPNVFDNLALRFSEKDLTNGRDELLVFYFAHIFSAPQYIFFGIGLQDFQNKLIDIYGRYVQVCHNGIQEVWVAWGVVGIILFFGMLIAMMLDSRRFSQKRFFYQYIPFLLMLLFTSAGQLIRSEVPLLSLTLIYICLSIPQENEKGRFV